MLKKALFNPYLLFSPFLLFYAYVIVINKWPTLYGDEIRYADFAWNILHGYYSPPPPHINLWNGPGYPLVIVPFMALKVHALYITLINAIYQYLSVVFLYKALKMVSNLKIAVVFSLLWAIYPNALAVLPILYTEAFTGLLISLIVYGVVLSYTRQSYKYIIMAGLALGYLALTKVIFGYVIIICIGIGLVLLLFKRHRPYYLKMVNILLIAFAVTIPYLTYTWHLTGKVLYWGNAGGMSLYWMSTPYDAEYGDWKVPDLTNKQYPVSFKSAEVIKLLKKNHSAQVGSIMSHDGLQQDDLFKKAALKNITTHPLKFIINYYYNVSRMLFNFPYSYAYQDGAIVGNIIRGSLILWASVFGLIVTFINWRKINFALKFVLLLTGVYLVLSGALSAYPRQLDIILPVLLVWMGFLTASLPPVKLKFTATESVEDIDLTDLKELNVLITDKNDYHNQ